MFIDPRLFAAEYKRSLTKDGCSVQEHEWKARFLTASNSVGIFKFINAIYIWKPIVKRKKEPDISYSHKSQFSTNFVGNCFILPSLCARLSTGMVLYGNVLALEIFIIYNGKLHNYVIKPTLQGVPFEWSLIFSVFFHCLEAYIDPPIWAFRAGWWESGSADHANCL